MTSESATAEEQAASFLQETLHFASHDTRPHVTLTFAQSQDGKIAGPGKTQLALSGAESMLMTHKLRTLHDGILVGIGTLLNDNPQLNARLLSNPPSVSELPRPVVLDSLLRMPVDCKLIRNHSAGTGRQPLVIASSVASSEKRVQLEKAGVEVVQMQPEASTSQLDWAQALASIRTAGITRLMVEGGAAVIDSLLQEPRLIDTLLVTIAPVQVGAEGFGFTAKLPDAEGSQSASASWTALSQSRLGKDQIMVWQRP